ncbi:uncharacterized protein LOC113142801 [Mastacembelus armatus]|uniref:uncharacterized protein LOC113142801 n=1 Tax=Mastacembelus armatus TaxID=205130 RepID=UPI000E45B43B|nr:uncharacterized protein LOC113142801 [Mastacembelus armatus]
MTVWWRALFLFSILNYVDSIAPSPVLQRNKYNNSFRLTRSIRTRVHQLLKNYKEQQLGNKHFEDRSQQLKNLPLLSTDFYNWLSLTDWERLHAAFRDMQVYFSMLEWKRKQLEKEEKNQVAVVPASLPQSIKHIQLDLRDLMNQVSSQMSNIRSSWRKPAFPPTPLHPESSKTVWNSRVEGYIILRDLDLYLTKLARDFLLLASKTHF